MNSDNDTVYILDSYGLIYRCYFAFINRPLTNKDGNNVSALFGFFRNLHYVFENYKPCCLVAAMDSTTKTFRHEFYPEYKANRDTTPEDLHSQIPWICDVLDALGIPVLQQDGYEADDIIATVVKKCKETGRNCRILSGDKDLMQLVDESAEILKPEASSTWKLMGVNDVEDEWGVKPEQLLDLLSLFGDSADNIPGVKGIGVKTASKLLGLYKDLDDIYAHIDEIKGAMQKKLIEGRENAYFSQKLVRLCDEVPCPEIDKIISRNDYVFNFSTAADLLKKLEIPAVAKQYYELAGIKDSPDENTDKKEKKKKNIQPDVNGELFSETDHVEVKKNTGSYRAVTSIDDLKNVIDEAIKTGTAAYDSETDSLNTITANILGFSLSYKKGEAVYVPIKYNPNDLFSISEGLEKEKAFKELERLFTDKDMNIVFHNAKFDLKVLISNGFMKDKYKNSSYKENDVFDFIKASIEDTMIISWILTPERPARNGYSLEYLGETVLGLKGIEFNDIVPKGMNFSDIELEKAVPYASEDADFTLQLWQNLGSRLKETESLWNVYRNIEMKVLPILVNMEIAGIHLTSKELLKYNQELLENISSIEENIYKEVGHEFNISSPKQLQTVLFEERKLKPGKKTKQGYSTDTSVLEDLSLSDNVPRMILEYRELSKLQSTYVETLPKLLEEDNRIHTDFIQTGTATGRLSCHEPNLQNIPIKTEEGRKIRSAFTAPEGKVLISADYAQIELVLFAHFSHDKNLCDAFYKGTDVHKSTASLIFGVLPEDVTPDMRRIAKVINFGVIYGMSPFRLAQSLGISRTEATEYIENYFKLHSSVNSFINETIINTEQAGYIETILGRRRYIKNINSRNKVEKKGGERVAVNSVIQGSAADIVKMAMIKVTQAIKEEELPAKLLLQVHDELIFECTEDKETLEKTIAIIKDKMENAVELTVPLRVSVEYGKNWGDFH